MHFGEFLEGYRVSEEAVRIKFLATPSDRMLQPGIVGYVDGFAKVLIMVSIVTFIHELDSLLC